MADKEYCRRCRNELEDDGLCPLCGMNKFQDDNYENDSSEKSEAVSKTGQKDRSDKTVNKRRVNKKIRKIRERSAFA